MSGPVYATRHDAAYATLRAHPREHVWYGEPLRCVRCPAGAPTPEPCPGWLRWDPLRGRAA